MKQLRLLIGAVLLALPFILYAQAEDLKQREKLLIEEKSEEYDLKEINIKEPDYGVLIDTEHIYHRHFMLKGKKKVENSLGNKVKPKIHVSTFAYEDEEEFMYALKFWFKEFIGGERVTPGRDYRKKDHVSPTIIVMDNNTITIVTFSCYTTEIEDLRKWRKDLLTIFGSPKAMIVEIGCGGPLEWTKNAPDPKDPKWRR